MKTKLFVHCAVLAIAFAGLAYSQGGTTALLPNNAINNAITAMPMATNAETLGNPVATTGLKVLVWADSGLIVPGQNCVLRAMAVTDQGPVRFTVLETFNEGGFLVKDSYSGENGINGYAAGLATGVPVILVNKPTNQSRIGFYTFTVNIIDAAGNLVQKPTQIVVTVIQGGYDSTATLRVDTMNQLVTPAGYTAQFTGRFPVNIPLFVYQGLPPFAAVAGTATSMDGRHLSMTIVMWNNAPTEQRVVLATGDGAFSTTVTFHLAVTQ